MVKEVIRLFANGGEKAAEGIEKHKAILQEINSVRVAKEALKKLVDRVKAQDPSESEGRLSEDISLAAFLATSGNTLQTLSKEILDYSNQLENLLF